MAPPLAQAADMLEAELRTILASGKLLQRSDVLAAASGQPATSSNASADPRASRAAKLRNRTVTFTASPAVAGAPGAAAMGAAAGRGRGQGGALVARLRRASLVMNEGLSGMEEIQEQAPLSPVPVSPTLAPADHSLTLLQQQHQTALSLMTSATTMLEGVQVSLMHEAMSFCATFCHSTITLEWAFAMSSTPNHQTSLLYPIVRSSGTTLHAGPQQKAGLARLAF